MPIKDLVDQLLSDLKKVYGSGQVVVLVNSLGAVTNLEMTLITNEVLAWFQNAGDEVIRIVTGGVMTSLDMNGISLTVLKVSELADKDDVLKWLDLQVDSPAWPKVVKP